MRMPNVRLSALAVVVTGVATIVTAILLMVVPGAAPPPATSDHPSKFTNTMMWFELAKDADELFANLGPSDDPVGQERREKLDGANRLDFAFMVAYSAFNGALIVLVWSLNRGKRFWNGLSIVGAGIILAALMLVGDVFENIQLLRLTGYAAKEDVPAEVMQQLNFWTRVKWGALFAESVLLAWGYTVYFLRLSENRFRFAGLIMAFFFAAAAAEGFPSLAVESLRFWLETASICLLPAWVFGLAHAAMFVVRPQKV